MDLMNLAGMTLLSLVTKKATKKPLKITAQFLYLLSAEKVLN